MLRRAVLVFLALVCFITDGTLLAQKPRLLDKATFYDMESVSNPAISPEGDTVLFSRGYVDMTRDQPRVRR